MKQRRIDGTHNEQSFKRVDLEKKKNKKTKLPMIKWTGQFTCEHTKRIE